MTRILTLLIGVATVLAACSSGGAASSPPPSPVIATIEGRTFLSTRVEGAALVPGTRVSLMFKSGNLSASGGCNSVGGAYSIAGGRLSVAQMMTTEMGCDQPRMQQDQWLASLLNGATITLAGDTLTLEKAPIRLTLLDRKVASPDKPLAGTRWVLDGIVNGGTASSVPAGVTASIQITAGRIDVDSGCNIGGGPVQISGNALTFGPIALTRKACAAGPASVESAVTALLAKPVDYAIDADVLTFTAGTTGLTFRTSP